MSTHGGTAEECYLFWWLKSVDWSVIASCGRESRPLTHGTSPSWGPMGQYSHQAIFHRISVHYSTWRENRGSIVAWHWWVFRVPEFLTVGHTRLGTFSCNFFPTFTDDVYLQFGISQCSDYCAYFILIVLRVRFSVNRRIYFITFPFCVEQIYSVAFFYLLPHWFHFMSF